MRILELTNYSSGSCGVFARALKEANFLLGKGHEVRIFSSNVQKGTGKIVPPKDNIGGVPIQRFPAIRMGGESYMRWNFHDEAVKFKPDVIIAHSYRHLHTHMALKVAKEIGARCILVTHAPFVMSTRSFFSRLAVSFYDKFIGPHIINKFDKVVTITQWEMPFLYMLSCDKSRIEQVPNGIQDEYFESGLKAGKGIFFFGRIAPIKNIELLINAVKDSPYLVDIIGPAEEDYKERLLNLLSQNKMDNVIFLPEVRHLHAKIKIMDNYEILVLPSHFESFGQVIIEAMARGKIVVASRTPGAREIIDDKKNGFLFDLGNASQLRRILLDLRTMPSSQKSLIRKAARKRAEDYRSGKAFGRLLKLL